MAVRWVLVIELGNGELTDGEVCAYAEEINAELVRKIDATPLEMIEIAFEARQIRSSTIERDQ